MTLASEADSSTVLNRPLSAHLDQVSKLFGSFAALRKVSVDLEPGRCYVLIGENGAGKSTLLRILAGLLRPTHGTVKVFGDSEPHDARARIGYMSHAPMLYDELTAEENLIFFAKLFSLPDPAERARRALEPVGLAHRAGDMVRTFSRGMRQRLAIARALLHGPRLLLLDEPAAGLDRQGLSWFGEPLARLRDEGVTVLMSTHARNESLDLATRAISLRGGRIEHDSGPGGDPRPLLAALRAEA